MNREEFAALRQKATEDYSALHEGKSNRALIQVSVDSSSLPVGAQELFGHLKAEVAKRGLNADVHLTSSFGMMWAEPTIFVTKPGTPRIIYQHVDTTRADQILTRWVAGNDPCKEFAFATFADSAFQGIGALKDHDWWRIQHRISLKNCGHIDPETINDYIATGGYSALEKVFYGDISPENVIAELRTSNLRGRGGAGFQVATKWESARGVKRTPRYVLVNGHEGEPNVFKDRRIFEGDPHSVLEGLIIGCWVVGSSEGYIYVGSEHPLALRRMGKAVEDARAAGLLGQNILGTGFDLDVKVIIAAGAYISGEASAMLYGVQGDRGMPRSKPPRSYEAGLWGQPTVVNNVESFNNVPQILLNGGAWYAAIGGGKSQGTKIVALSGTVKRPSLFEVPFGIRSGDIVDVVGGGSSSDLPIKALQTGGASGGAIRKGMGVPGTDITDQWDMKFDIDLWNTIDCLLGSAGVIAYDTSVCMVDAVYYMVRFNRDESCGKCIPCRIGCEGLTEILWRIKTGQGRMADLDAMDGLSDMVIEHSLCGLGQAAPVPLKNGLKYWRDEFLDHIQNKTCPQGVCPMNRAQVTVIHSGVPAVANLKDPNALIYQ